jgi:hypothetical protein
VTDDRAPRGAPRDARDDAEARRVGLCVRCVSARKITSGKGSVFWMCQAPGLPKYPPLPVLRCSAFVAAAVTPACVLMTVAVAIALTGCASPAPTSGSAATVDVPAPAPLPTPSPGVDAPAPPASTGSAPAGSGPLVGVWTSPSCGARTYERVLALGADGNFTATDRVSPCPPGARCIWAGIIVREGTWSASAGRLALTLTSDGQGPGNPLPASLLVEGGAPVEEDGATRCAYARK